MELRRRLGRVVRGWKRIAASAKEPLMLNPGDPAPDFAAPAHDGRRIALRDLRGTKVLLWFYPKADTPGCTAEGCGFRDRIADFGQLDVAILGVSFDTPEENAAFAKKFGFPYPLLSDADRRMALAYGAADDASARTARRVSCLIDEHGKVLKHYLQVAAREHPGEVLADLADLAE
jgi:peroxiredoxin Q/BCP